MKMFWLIIFSVSLVSTAQIASSSPSSKAFDEFQQRCVAIVVNGDIHSLDGLQAIPPKDTRNVLAALEADPSQADKTRIWLTSSDRYFMFTKVGEDAFCQLVGVQVDFPDMRSAFLNWRDNFGDGYKSDGDFKLRSMKSSSLNKQVARIFMAKPTQDGGVMQIFMQYRPDFQKGFASIILVRLPVMSSAAKELFANQ